MNRNCGNPWRLRASTAIVIAAALIAGCAETSRPTATGKGKVRGINSIVTSPELIFLTEERPMGNINYRGVAGFTEWDNLTYNFNFDVIRPNAAEAERLATQVIDVLADVEHTTVLTGTIANPSLLYWETEAREWDGSETVFEVDFFHASPLLGQVDVYYDLEGTAPVVGNEVGTLGFGDRIPYVEREQDDYELILTAPGDPSTVIFQSPGVPRLPRERITFALYDTDPSIVADAGVGIIFESGVSQGIPDVNSPPQLRLTHASFGVGNIDGYLNNDFGTVVFPNVGFDQSSAYVEFSETILPVDVTPTGDPATLLVEADIQRLANTRRSMLFWGLPGAHFLRVLLHDARPIEIFPVVRLTHLSSNVDDVDIYVVAPGTVLDETVVPLFNGAIPGISTGFFAVEVGMTEYVVTLPGEKTPIAAPVVFDQAAGEVLDLIVVDTADPATVEIRIFDSIP